MPTHTPVPDTCVNLTSPNSTLGGDLRKKRKLIDGVRVLVKGGVGFANQEPYNEVIATELHRRLLEPGDFTPYRLLAEGRRVYSACDNMLRDGEELVSAYDLIRRRKQRNTESDLMFYVRCCRELGVCDDDDAIMDGLAKMFACDYVLANRDRHWRNFGVMRDVHTLRATRLAPIFDTGSCLWSDAPTLELPILAVTVSRHDVATGCVASFLLSSGLDLVGELSTWGSGGHAWGGDSRLVAYGYRRNIGPGTRGTLYTAEGGAHRLSFDMTVAMVLQAAAVSDQIRDLPDASAIRLSDRERVTAVRAAFEALDEGLLEAAEVAIVQLLVDALPASVRPADVDAGDGSSDTEGGPGGSSGVGKGGNTSADTDDAGGAGSGSGSPGSGSGSGSGAGAGGGADPDAGSGSGTGSSTDDAGGNTIKHPKPDAPIAASGVLNGGYGPGPSSPHGRHQNRPPDQAGGLRIRGRDDWI